MRRLQAAAVATAWMLGTAVGIVGVLAVLWGIAYLAGTLFGIVGLLMVTVLPLLVWVWWFLYCYARETM